MGRWSSELDWKKESVNVQERVTDIELVLPLVNLVCAQCQRISLQPCASSSHRFLNLTHERQGTYLGHTVANRGMNTMMVGKAVQLRLGGLDGQGRTK